MKLQRLALAEIDFQDETYLLQPVCPQEPSPSLVASLKRVGILHPPLVDQAGRGRYRILSGRNRLLAARRLNFTSCDCRVLPATSSPLENFTLLLEEKITFTPPTIIEQAIFFKKIRAWLELEKAAQRFLPLLGLEAHPSQAEKLLRLNNLEEVIQEALHAGSLDPKVGWQLEKLSFFDRMSLFETMVNLKLSVANQKKITLISREIAGRSKTNIATVLSGEECQTILNRTDLNLPQKTARFMGWLQEKQFPRYSQAEEEFTEFCRSCHLPPGVTLNHSPFFEKDEISLTLTFKNREALRQKLPLLKELAGND